VKELPGRARWLIRIVPAVTAALLTILALRLHPFGGDYRVDFGFAITFGILIFVADQFPVSLPSGVGSVSVSFVLTIAAIVLRGPVEAGIATAFGFTTLKTFRSTALHRHLFNMSNPALSATLAGLTYMVLIRHEAPDATHTILGVLAATGVEFLVNTGLVALIVASVKGERAGRLWRNQYRKLISGYLAFAGLGVVLATLYKEMGNASVIFLLVPLLVARGTFQSAIDMEKAYDSTVRSLIKAIEAKDPYTRGHAERVAKLSEMTARAYGLSSEECRILRYIALMHDVGKLGVSTKILAKPGKLTDEEYEHMKQHPLRGFEIVSDIDFLHRAAETAVRHHHERMDGRGYPDGLAGEEIPVFARIVMVCDAFDAMTSTRVYRKAKGIEDALVELNRCVGTQFDPVALRALEKALATEGWEAEPEPREEQEVAADAAALAL
jgi:HD domain-containing protein/MASE9 protein